MSNNKEGWADLIINARKDLGISRSEVALEVGVTKQTIALWETESRTPKTRDLWSLFRYLRLSDDDMVSFLLRVRRR
jgi:DNA-binding XRE family transcriptional regulator